MLIEGGFKDEIVISSQEKRWLSPIKGLREEAVVHANGDGNVEAVAVFVAKEGGDGAITIVGGTIDNGSQRHAHGRH